ncbi:hypothetical protein GCM10011514_18870 [Emticicia aquatilis]|uniref:Glycosyl hydrolase n=1 Tax=Emticicia aquatilis TaxID=1537369 RepID=A0A916YQ01_9BACT|nr:3-coathanger stack domain-containing protein [Emticicia aquatilis]GGD54914.1 hypothetical protein GCM10011514_18870 [Emticicia aquatilis]
MKNNLYLYLLLLSIPFFAISQEEKENPEERARFEYERTKDPKTGLMPRHELEKSRAIMSKMIKLMAPIPNITWVERGPNNVGGRTRALMWDPNDANKKKVWAGGVSGGLWYNNDITTNTTVWTKVNDFWDNIAIGCITYDPSNTQIMYVGTGERSASDKTDNTGASGTGGGGIWKSTNGGTSWSLLTSTIPDYVNSTTLASSWREVLNIVVNAQGHVFALTFQGVLKSTDGGTTWATLTGTGAPAIDYNNPGIITDMKMGSDGILYIAEGGVNNPKIYKSTDNTASAFTTITPAGTFAPSRVELALAPSTSGNSQVIYAVAAGSRVAFFKKSVDAGANWTDVIVPLDVDGESNPKPPFTGKQGTYNLVLGIKPTDPNVIYAGGTTIGISYTGGVSVSGNPAWKFEYGSNYFYPPTNKFFVDNHAFAARPGFPNEAIFGNDGGVFYSAEWGDATATAPDFQRRTNGYNVTQFFGVAMAGAANAGLVMGGAQDNGSQTITSNYGTLGNGFEIKGGDGGLCFIDQEDSNILIASYTNLDVELFPNGPTNKTGAIALDNDKERGSFINAADYDSPNNKLYTDYSIKNESVTENKIRRYLISGTAPNYAVARVVYTLDAGLPALTALKISVIKVGPSNTLYIGTSDGDVYKTANLPDADQTITLTKIMDKANTSVGNVSSIDFANGGQTMVVTKSNYNIKSVFYTVNGGTNWTSKDETGYGLQNIPIRYALINPVDTKQVLLATELGVWSTSDITATNPQWSPTNASLANVRCDMLRYRSSDNTVAVATHGRGIFTTKLNQNSTPCPTTLVLISTADDKATGTTTFQASESISASNKITGTATVTMKAGKSVELKPSTNGGGTTFEAANGTVFQAYIQGCTN